MIVKVWGMAGGAEGKRSPQWSVRRKSERGTGFESIMDQMMEEWDMDKKILKEYEALRTEIADVSDRIKRIEKRMEKFSSNYEVIDSVSGGEGNLRHYRVAGFPYPEFSRNRSTLAASKWRMEQLREELEGRVMEVEEYIASVENSRMRSILRMRYMDGMTWAEIAKKFGAGYTEDAIRVEHDRFMKKQQAGRNV